MLDQKKMDRFKQSGASAALELREEIIAGLKGQISDTMQAINGYFADREKRQKAISDRIEALKNQREALEAEVAAIGPRLAAATISGDVNTLEQIQSRLTDLEAQKAAISAQIELLSGVSVAGDKELFGKADEKARSLDQFWTDTLADL